MTSLIDQLTRIETKRQDKNWQPKEPSINPSTLIHPTIGQALELRALEISVQNWTIYHSQTHPQEEGYVRDMLMRHATDEDKHDVQLDYLAKYWGHESVSESAQQLIQDWQSDPSDPMVKKLGLEAGVFFPILAMMAMYGKGDIFTQSVRQWINSDENAHVASARLLVRHHQLKITRSVLGLIDKTIHFLTVDLSQAERDKWVRLSRQTLTTGKMSNTEDLSIVSVPESLTLKSNLEIAYQIPG